MPVLVKRVLEIIADNSEKGMYDNTSSTSSTYNGGNSKYEYKYYNFRV